MKSRMERCIFFWIWELNVTKFGIGLRDRSDILKFLFLGHCWFLGLTYGDVVIVLDKKFNVGPLRNGSTNILLVQFQNERI